MKAVINYGHGPLNSGGYDPGAIGPTGYQEATQNKEVGELVVKKLRANGWDILAIQDGNLWDVTNRANAFKPNAFISIHADSFADPSAHGVSTFALSPGGMGEKIAREIQKELVAATGLTDRGVKFANYHVLRETISYPAVLAEIGFISNPAEEALMREDAWDDKVASAICRGLSRAMGVAYLEQEGDSDVLDVAVLLFTKDDFWAGADVASKEGCGVFIRQIDKSVPADARDAKKLIVVGGSSTGHREEVLLSGRDKYDTAAAVKKYLG